MGQAGKLRVNTVYDWSTIIAQYEQLWSKLAEIRRSEKFESLGKSTIWPARIDPFWSFSSYPSKILQLEMQFALVDVDVASALARYQLLATLDMVSFAKIVMPTDAEVLKVFEALKDGPVSAQKLIDIFSKDRKYLVLRSLVWLAKIGLLKLA